MDRLGAKGSKSASCICFRNFSHTICNRERAIKKKSIAGFKLTAGSNAFLPSAGILFFNARAYNKKWHFFMKSIIRKIF